MKLSELINFPVTVKSQSGFPSFVSAKDYQFAVGRLKDRNLKPWEGDNFESCVPQKGVPKKDWNWKPTKFNQEAWYEKFSWKFEVEGETVWLDLTWTQNNNLTALLKGETDVTVYPFLDGKKIDFSLTPRRPGQGITDLAKKLPESDETDTDYI